MTDLWPDDISVTKMRAPYTILKEQASFLGNRTKNLIIAKIERQEDDFGGDEILDYAFYIVAPALGNYRYQLFSMVHDIELYPVKIFTSEAIMSEVILYREDNYFLARDEKQFIEIISKIFHAKKTKRIIHALLAQVESADPYPADADAGDIPF